MSKLDFLLQLQWAINFGLIPELKGLRYPVNFTWRSLFELSSAHWDRTTMEEKARILGYLETCQEKKGTLLDRLIKEYIQYSERENRPDSVHIIPLSLEKIRKQIPNYRALSPCLSSPVEYISTYVTDYTKRKQAISD